VDELLRLLELECRHLEHVRYRTSVALLLLRGDESRFLPRAADEIHAAVDEVGQIELLRATVVSRLADELGVPEDVLTLTALIRSASPATAEKLRELQERLRTALTELQQLTSASTVVAATGLESVRRSLGRFSGSANVPGGYVAAPPVVPSRFDGAF
jgi:hypothetical protein